MASCTAAVCIALCHIGCSSRGGPGNTTTVGVPGTTTPGAVPTGSRMCEPAGIIACLRLAARTVAKSGAPAPLKRAIIGLRMSAMWASRAGSSTTSRPQNRATVSTVRSSAVGPRPPLVMIRSTPSAARNRSWASMSRGRSPQIVMCANSTPSSRSRSASHGPLRSAIRPVSTSVPVTTIPARALTGPRLRPQRQGKPGISRTSGATTGATGAVGAATGSVGAATGAVPPKFGNGNGSTDPRFAGRLDNPGRPVPVVAGVIEFCAGGTLKVAVASGDCAGEALGAGDVPPSADVVVSSSCCGMVVEEATTCSTTPGSPGLIGAASASAVALDASAVRNNPAAAPAATVRQLRIRDMAFPNPDNDKVGTEVSRVKDDARVTRGAVMQPLPTGAAAVIRSALPGQPALELPQVGGVGQQDGVLVVGAAVDGGAVAPYRVDVEHTAAVDVDAPPLGAAPAELLGLFGQRLPDVGRGGLTGLSVHCAGPSSLA